MTTKEAIEGITPAEYRSLVSYAQRKLWHIAPDDGADLVQEAICRALSGSRVWYHRETGNVVHFLKFVIKSLAENMRTSWWQRIADGTAICHQHEPLTDDDDKNEFFGISVPPIQYQQAEATERVRQAMREFAADPEVRMFIVVRALGGDEKDLWAILGSERRYEAARKRFKHGAPKTRQPYKIQSRP